MTDPIDPTVAAPADTGDTAAPPVDPAVVTELADTIASAGENDSGPDTRPTDGAILRYGKVTEIGIASNAGKVRTDATGLAWLTYDNAYAPEVGDLVYLLMQGPIAHVGGQLGGTQPTPPPVGVVHPYAGAVAPTGWAIANGAALSRTGFPQLFAVCGTTYGAGDGSTTFNIPNLTDRIPTGSGALYARGETGGSETRTLTIANLPAHDHTATQGTHDHTGVALPAHDHGSTAMAAHDHAGSALPAHDHGSVALPAHDHTGISHSHTMTHDHTGTAHSHSMTHDHAVSPHTHTMPNGGAAVAVPTGAGQQVADDPSGTTGATTVNVAAFSGNTSSVAGGVNAYSGSTGATTPNVNATSAGTPTINTASAGTPQVAAASAGTPTINTASAGTPNINANSAGAINIGSTGSGTAFNNMPPYLGLTYIIRTLP